MNEILRTENLWKSYWHGNKEIQVLKNICFSVECGQMISIVGASGAGKSTLLHLLGTLDLPTKGDVFFEGMSLFQRSEEDLATFRNHKIGFVFQFHHLLPEFSALENVMMPMLISGSSKKAAQEEASQKLHEMGLSHRLHHKPNQLSGGEQQRVAVARALIINPAVLLADELTGNLDTKTGEEMVSMLIKLNEKYRMTMIVVTHNELLAKKMEVQFKIVDGTLFRIE